MWGLLMIFRDLYRCPPEDFHRALAASSQTVLRRGAVEPCSAIEPADVDYLVAYPDFDPSLSFLAYDAGEPVACLVSRLGTRHDETEAVLSLLVGRPEAARAREMLLDEALDHWRREGARRARQGLTGLIGSQPRLAEDADVIALLDDRGFEIQAESVLMSLVLKALAKLEGAGQREDQLRQKGYAIREGLPEDVPIIARQYHPRHTRQIGLELWNHLVRHLGPGALFIAEFRRQFVGCLVLLGWTLGGDSPALGPSFVDEIHRPTGLDALLRRHALLATRQAGKARVQVHCPASRAATYERLGFTTQSRLCARAVAELD